MPITIPFAVLDLAPIVQGGDAARSFRNTVELARHTERLGFGRFWLAEHHGMPGVASAATSVLIAHVAAHTSTIRVGAGGIMLPNHAPLLIAEQFGTLESLHPGRIDLGLGRAPGSDQATARALRRSPAAANAFTDDVLELMAYFRAEGTPYGVRAVPGAGLAVPIWILGSSLFGAQLAAALGLPFAFASHFAPAQLMQAAEIYRRDFRPSAGWPRPYLMVGVNVIAADEEAEARRMFSSLQQVFVNLRRGTPTPFPPPVDGFDERLDPGERLALAQMLSYAVIGEPEAVRAGLERIVADTGADELILSAPIYDHAARLRSYEIAAAARSGAA
jgi:luciferase family oxidoreductase group 1